MPESSTLMKYVNKQPKILAAQIGSGKCQYTTDTLPIYSGSPGSTTTIAQTPTALAAYYHIPE